MSGNVLDYIAKGVNSNYLGSFAEGLGQGQQRAALQQKMDEAIRVRNALQRAAQLAQNKDYPGTAGALIEGDQVPSGVSLLTSSDPSLAANRTRFFQPQLVFDDHGQPHYVQANDHSGNMQEAKMPPGWYPAPNIGMADTGTGLVPYNKRGPLNQIGQGAAAPSEGGGAPQSVVQNGVIPKDVSGAAQQKEQGQLAGKATVALPTVETNVQTALDTIQRLRDNKEGRDWARGPVAGRVPAVGGAQADWVKDYDQLQGATFLDAYESLRGAQAITDIEGQKGTEAKTSLNRVGSDKAFDSALNRLEGLFRKGLDNARKKAAMGGSSPQQAAGGEVGGGGQASVEQETALLRQSKLFQTNPDAAIAKFAERTGMSADEARKMLGM